ncbi:MAG TPA: NrfD/PsrC family molybdoenzyme membrane anchor subunit [Cyclobacteriaceae bacterium]|nr:NrfD/PsrC family molybdoenzyme membrane anchor subunit [Cyclobacteriaceae bacterium]
MMSTANYQNLIKEFIPNLERPTARWYLWVGFLAILVLFGIYALARQILEGQIITGMRDNAVWGIYTANFVFFMGLSYAGALISCTFQLLRIQWGKPLLRMAELITVSSLIVGAPYILFCLGRLDRIHFLFLHGRIQSPITWDVIAIVTDLIFCITFLYMTHIRDFAKLRDYPGLNISPWRKKLYSALSLGYRGSPLQDKYLHQALDIMAIIIIPTAIIAYSLLSWLFGMSLRPGWHSTIFGPYFVVTASYSGIALLILIMWIYRKTNRIGSILTNQHFNYMSFGLLIVGLFYAYFTFSEYITEWYNITETTAKLFSKFFLGSRFGWMAMIHIFFAIVIPIIVLGIPWFRTVTNVTFVSLLIVIGLWVKRYLIVVPTLETPFIPIQDIRPAWANYSVSWVELALTISGIALVVLIFTIASKIAPIIPVSEIEDMDEPKPVVEYTMRGI